MAVDTLQEAAAARVTALATVMGGGLPGLTGVLHKVLAWTGHHGHGLGWLDWLSFGTATVGIAFIGGAFYRSAWRAARRGTSNMDTLISMGASVAYGYSLVAMAGALLGWWATPPLYFTSSVIVLGVSGYLVHDTDTKTWRSLSPAGLLSPGSSLLS